MSSPKSTTTHLPWAPLGNPTPESTLTLCQSRLYPPVRDFGFGICSVIVEVYNVYVLSLIYCTGWEATAVLDVPEHCDGQRGPGCPGCGGRRGHQDHHRHLAGQFQNSAAGPFQKYHTTIPGPFQNFLYWSVPKITITACIARIRSY
jgi:hypothetical protein